MYKSSIGLVEYAKAQLSRPYWFGTFGQCATESLWDAKSKQYPKYYSDKRKTKMLERGDIGQKVHDCLGLWKGYMMSTGINAGAIYDPTYDLSADGIFNMASEKGSIDTLPDIPGIGLYKKGHFGVYIGGGREIEARGFDYGVLEDSVAGGRFTHWFKIPYIEYSSAEVIPEPVQEIPENKPEIPAEEKVSDTAMPLIKQGSTGKAVMIWQVIVGTEADGKFGPKTQNKTREFQAAHGLEVDGIVGPKSWKAGLESV